MSIVAQHASSQYKPAGRILHITPLERQALQLLANERATSDVAVRLGIDTLEVETLLTTLFTAMGAATLADAIASARKRGLLTIEPL